MKLQFENIISFVTVVETGSFSSAARKMGKSQSTVSTAVQNLESDLGFILFIRESGKVTLSDKGKRFYHLSTPIVSKYRDLLSVAGQMSKAENIVFRIGVDPLVFTESVKKTLFDFSEAFPNIDLVVVTKPSFVLSNYINEGRIDLALGNPYHKTNNEFNTDELFQVNCWWVGHPDLIQFSESCSWRVLLMDGVDDLLNLSDFAARGSWRFDDISTIVELCKERKGIASCLSMLSRLSVTAINWPQSPTIPSSLAEKSLLHCFGPCTQSLVYITSGSRTSLKPRLGCNVRLLPTLPIRRFL
ncbi:transcriptional regulator LysR family [Vibrio maritimus]|uniref:Transcriptional regulator LysR family n=1 Tax=Vibrio maritimus TaxID=990268 RepID=A0A090S024_9VIBR|nr:transcriptional regulator LysR family [Vibrio maritimus]